MVRCKENRISKNKKDGKQNFPSFLMFGQTTNSIISVLQCCLSISIFGCIEFIG